MCIPITLDIEYHSFCVFPLLSTLNTTTELVSACLAEDIEADEGSGRYYTQKLCVVSTQISNNVNKHVYYACTGFFQNQRITVGPISKFLSHYHIRNLILIS